MPPFRFSLWLPWGLLLALVLHTSAAVGREPAPIPRPARLTQGRGEFRLVPGTTVATSRERLAPVRRLAVLDADCRPLEEGR